MARYIPTDGIARQIAKDWLRERIERQFNREGIVAAIGGEMAEDGSWAIHLRADRDLFNFRTFNEVPQLDGRIWIDDHFSPHYDVDFGGPLAVVRFYDEYGG